MGLVLIMVTPGGTVSNLMTYFAKGDLALSVSLTSFSTVLSIFFTPMLLTFYCSMVTDVPIPTGFIMQIIFGLVLVPLAIGMLINNRWPVMAEKAVPYFSRLGFIALIFIIGAGVLTNLEKFADTDRYGLVEYLYLFGLSFAGLLLGMIIPKLLRINNYQTRALSMENGLRNTVLAMTISILLEDIVGDFHSSMFAISAFYGVGMYIWGLTFIYIFKRFLPLGNTPDRGSSAPDSLAAKE